MDKLFIRLILAMSILIIITLPHLTLIFFDWGIDYGQVGMIICAFMSVISAQILQPTDRIVTAIEEWRRRF